MKLSDKIRDIDCRGNLLLKINMFEIADAVDAMEKDHANAIAATTKIMEENNSLSAELAALREKKIVSLTVEDLKDWPEDSGEHPQRGIAK